MDLNFNMNPKRQPLFKILNPDRTNSILIHRQKRKKEIKYSKKLCGGYPNFYSTINDLIQNTKTKNSILNGPSKQFVIIEDFLDFNQSINNFPKIWSCVTEKQIYIRTLENGFSINRDDNQVKKGIDKSKDELIAKNSSFSKILDEKEKK